MHQFSDPWRQIASGVILAATMATAHAQTYRITELGAVPSIPGSFSTGQAINDAGQIAGFVYGDGPRAALWSAGTGWRDIGTLPGYDFSHARALNNAGMVVGDTVVYGPGTAHAFRWTSATGMQALNPLPGDNGSHAYAVNAGGWVAGSSFLDVGGSTSERAVVWDAAGRPMPLPQGFTARGINDAGHVVGQNQSGQAFVWSAEDGSRTLTASRSEALAINDAGMATGSVEGALPNSRLGFVWAASGGLRTFASPGDPLWTDPKALNDAGTVVGSFQFPGWRSFAFVWSKDTGVRPLEQLVDRADPLFGQPIYDAWAINDHGQIAASASLPDGTIGILLTPVPEPATLGLCVAGLLGLGARRSLRRA